jgi:hypothetical protein
MEDYRLPKQLLNYHPKGRRRPGRPLKTLLDDMTAENETDHPGLNSRWSMILMSQKYALHGNDRQFITIVVQHKNEVTLLRKHQASTTSHN